MYLRDYRLHGSDVVKHTFEWTSNASGNATIPSMLPVSGAIARVAFVPDSVAAPTASYDVTLTDSDGIDVLAGQGANLSDTLASHVCPGVPLKDGTTIGALVVVVDSVLTLNVSNAGNTKSGKVVVYVR